MIGVALESLLPVAAEIGAHILLKATVVLAVAGLATVLLRRASAAARYMVWSVAFAVLIMLPLMAVSLPPWSIDRLAGLWSASDPGTPAPAAASPGAGSANLLTTTRMMMTTTTVESGST